MKKSLKLEKYIYFLLNKFVLFASPLIELWELGFYRKYGNTPLKHQPVFIIGAPRTGSTILYQAITNQLDVLYIDNLVCKFYRNLFFGFWLSNKLFKQRAHNCFKSDHGDTSKYGLRAPSECGQFWYRWLPRNRHFIDYDDINEKMVEEIRREITTIINYFNKPIIFKNLNAGQRLRLLKKCFPNAKFIFIRRNPISTAQSIINAREKNNIKKHEWWSIKPKNYKDLLALPENEMCMAQIYYLEKQIEQDLKLFPERNVFSIHYQELSTKRLKRLQGFIGAPLKNERVKMPSFKNESKQILTEKYPGLFNLACKYPFSRESYYDR